MSESKPPSTGESTRSRKSLTPENRKYSSKRDVSADYLGRTGSPYAPRQHSRDHPDRRHFPSPHSLSRPPSREKREEEHHHRSPLCSSDYKRHSSSLRHSSPHFTCNSQPRHSFPPSPHSCSPARSKQEIRSPSTQRRSRTPRDSVFSPHSRHRRSPPRPLTPSESKFPHPSPHSTARQHTTPPVRRRLSHSQKDSSSSSLRALPRSPSPSVKIPLNSLTNTAPNNPALDFLSSSFEPLACLQSSAFLPPYPHVSPLERFELCFHLMPASIRPDNLRAAAPKPSKVAAAPHLPSSATTATTTATTTVAAAPTSPAFVPTVVGLSDQLSKGPHAVLTHLLREGRKARVLLRGAQGLQGYCEGYVIAFDHHFNLFLRDVYEKWTAKQPVPTQTHKGTVRIRRRPVTTTKHIPQILLRGSNVVSVFAVPFTSRAPDSDLDD